MAVSDPPSQTPQHATAGANRARTCMPLVVWLPLTVVVCVGMLRPMKGLMLAAQFANRASEARNDD